MDESNIDDIGIDDLWKLVSAATFFFVLVRPRGARDDYRG